jgi:hypothetical protein
MNELWKAIWLEAHFRRFNEGKSSRQGPGAMLADRIPAIDDVRHLSSAWVTDHKGRCGQSTDEPGHYQTIILDQTTCPECLAILELEKTRAARIQDARTVSALVTAILALFPKPPAVPLWAVPPVPGKRRRRPRMTRRFG